MSAATDRRRKAEIVSAMGGACYVCGEDRLAVLTLHHRYGRNAIPNTAPRRFRSLWLGPIVTETWAEVWLCDLLCSNCHLSHHTVVEGSCWDYLA